MLRGWGVTREAEGQGKGRGASAWDSKLTHSHRTESPIRVTATLIKTDLQPLATGRVSVHEAVNAFTHHSTTLGYSHTMHCIFSPFTTVCEWQFSWKKIKKVGKVKFCITMDVSRRWNPSTLIFLTVASWQISTLTIMHIPLSPNPTVLFCRAVNHNSVKYFLDIISRPTVSKEKKNHAERGENGRCYHYISHRKWECLKICMVVWSLHKGPSLAISKFPKPTGLRLAALER